MYVALRQKVEGNKDVLDSLLVKTEKNSWSKTINVQENVCVVLLVTRHGQI